MVGVLFSRAGKFVRVPVSSRQSASQRDHAKGKLARGDKLFSIVNPEWTLFEYLGIERNDLGTGGQVVGNDFRECTLATSE